MTAFRAVSIDLALRATGISATHDHTGAPGVLTRTVHADRLSGHERIRHILTDIAAAVKCKPHVVAIEAVFAGTGKGGTPLRLAEVHGVVGHWLWSKGLPVVYVEPQQIKIWATGNGNATKDDVQAAVTAQYGHLCHVADEHQADSLALLGLTAAAYGHSIAPTRGPRHERAIHSVKWPALDTGLAEALAAGWGPR